MTISCARDIGALDVQMSVGLSVCRGTLCFLKSFMVYYDVVNLIRVSQFIDKTILAQSDLKLDMLNTVHPQIKAQNSIKTRCTLQLSFGGQILRKISNRTKLCIYFVEKFLVQIVEFREFIL